MSGDPAVTWDGGIWMGRRRSALSLKKAAAQAAQKSSRLRPSPVAMQRYATLHAAYEGKIKETDGGNEGEFIFLDWGRV